MDVKRFLVEHEPPRIFLAELGIVRGWALSVDLVMFQRTSKGTGHSAGMPSPSLCDSTPSSSKGLLGWTSGTSRKVLRKWKSQLGSWEVITDFIQPYIMVFCYRNLSQFIH